MIALMIRVIPIGSTLFFLWVIWKILDKEKLDRLTLEFRNNNFSNYRMVYWSTKERRDVIDITWDNYKVSYIPFVYKKRTINIINGGFSDSYKKTFRYLLLK